MKKTDPQLIIKNAFITILPAQLLAALIPYLSGIINGLVLGNFYDNSLISVIGYTMPVVYFQSAIRTLFSIGGGATAGNYMGKGDLGKVNEAFRLCVQTLIIIGAARMLSIFLFNRGIAGILTKASNMISKSM